MPSAVRLLRAAAASRAGAGAAALLRDLEALVLPATCLGCQRRLPAAEADAVCCAECRSRMRRIPPPVCGRCGQPLDNWERQTGGWADRRLGRARPFPAVQPPSRPSTCGFCRNWPAELAWATSAVWLEDGPARELAHALKYGGWTCAARPMAAVIARACGTLLPRGALLVPIPLGKARERERGHNQAVELARALGAALRLPVAPRALARRRDTQTQTALARAERWRNVAGAFIPGADAVGGRRVVLVDDVLTTGATLAVAAGALAAAGAADVGAVTFGRAVVPR